MMFAANKQRQTFEESFKCGVHELDLAELDRYR